MALDKEQRALVILALAGRKADAATRQKIDNSSLYAGSNMYYYCKLCGQLAAELPECHLEMPPKHCEHCARIFKEYEMTMEEVVLGLKELSENANAPQPKEIA